MVESLPKCGNMLKMIKDTEHGNESDKACKSCDKSSFSNLLTNVL